MDAARTDAPARTDCAEAAQSPFVIASQVEQEAWSILLPYFKGTHEIVLTDGSPHIQKLLGDAISKRDGRYKTVEVKAETRHTGNLYLETWSNREWFTPGWMVYSNSDVLAYYFLDTNQLYTVPMRKLKVWAWHGRNIYRYDEVAQKKYNQRNDGWGRIVPVDDLRGIEGFVGPIYPNPNRA